MDCRSMLAVRLVGVGMRRLRGVGGTWEPWALLWVSLGSCSDEEVETTMIYGSSLSILARKMG